MPQPAYRSPWGKHVGGASQQVGTYQQAGYTSFLWFGGAGGDKPDFVGDYADRCSMLAFWMGGARMGLYRRIPSGAIIGPEGPPFAKHHVEEKRRPIDDEEVIEFLELWTAWQDIE